MSEEPSCRTYLDTPPGGQFRRKIRGLARLLGLLGWLFLPLGSMAGAASQKIHFVGQAFDMQSGALLYREVHDLEMENGKVIRGKTVFLNAEGKQIAHKTTDFSADPYVPVFRLEIPGVGYADAITGNGDRVVMARKTNGTEQTAEAAKEAPMAADGGLLNYIADHFTTLLDGNPMKLSIAVAARLETYNVRLRRIEDVLFDGRPAIRFQLEHDSPLRLLVNPLVLTYERDTRRLLEYRGQSNIGNPKTGDPYEVRIFYTQPSRKGWPGFRPDV